jgi:hypothetical protein
MRGLDPRIQPKTENRLDARVSLRCPGMTWGVAQNISKYSRCSQSVTSDWNRAISASLSAIM